MKDFLENINKQLKKEVKKFEKSQGLLEDNMSITINEILAEIAENNEKSQLLSRMHTMNLKDNFIYPDLKCLVDYEKELNARHKKR